MTLPRIRVAAFADLHLGRKSAPGRDWARDAASAAASQGCQAVVFAGDLFDRRKARERHVGQAVELCRHITEELGLPLVMCWGNHDAAAGLIPNFPQLPGVLLPAGDSPATIPVPGLPLHVHTVNVTAHPDPREAADLLPAPSSGVANLGLLHTSLDGRFDVSDCLPVSPATLAGHGYDAWVLGHVHEPTVLSEEPRIFWAGMGRMEIVDLPVPAHPRPASPAPPR